MRAAHRTEAGTSLRTREGSLKTKVSWAGSRAMIAARAIVPRTPPHPRPAGPETRRMRSALQRKLFGEDTYEPAKLGRFVVLDRVGEGGMGTVFSAYDPELDRKVAVKVLRWNRGTPRHLELLVAEAKSMAKLNHPHVVTVHEVGMVDDNPFVAMEYVDGGNLGDWCETQPPQTQERFEQALEFFVQACAGLRAAHDVGIVHRDVKPTNLLVGNDGRLRVADFGLARPVPSSPASSNNPDNQRDESATNAAGTPAYMAPEQFEGHADARSDQFGLCATFWEVFHGERAFGASTLTERTDEIRRGPIANPNGTQALPPALERILLRGLASDPRDRFPTTEALGLALEDVRRPRRARMWPWALAVVGVGVLAWGLGAAPAPPEHSPTQEVICSASWDELDRVWNEKTRAKMRDSFVDTGAPEAQRTHALVDQKLEAYARRVGEAHRDHCLEPARISEACVVAATGAFETTIDILSHADLETLRRASDATYALPDPRSCDVGRPNPDPAQEQTPAAQTVVRNLARARASASLHRDDDARALVETARRSADDAGLLALRGQVDLLSSVLQFRADSPEGALTAAWSTLEAAERTGWVDLEIQAWRRASIAVRSLGRLDDAEFYLDRAFALLERNQSPPEREAELLYDRGSLRDLQGRPDEALDAYQRSLRQYRALPNPPLNAIAMVLVDQVGLGDRLTETPDDLPEHALGAAIDAYGAGHPVTGMAMYNLAIRHAQAGRLEEAIALFEATIPIFEAFPEHRPTSRALLMSAYANALEASGRFDEAHTAIDAAEGHVAGLPSGHPYRLMISATRGATLFDEGRFDEAAVLYEEWLERDDGSEVVTILRISVLLNFAVVQATRGHSRHALELAEKGRAAVDSVADPKSPPGFGALRYAADTYRLCDKLEEAERTYRVALGLVDQDSNPIEVAGVQLGMAKLARARGEHDEARRWSDESMATLQGAGEPGALWLERAQAWRDEHLVP